MYTTLDDLLLDSCSNASGYLSNDAGDFALPVTVINGAHPGKTILITGGIHGSEYPGVQTAIELAYEIDPAEVTGRIIIAHPANPAAFLGRTSAVCPQDGKNLNRVFPGDPEGTYAEKLAHLITTQLHSHADFYIDLHGGDLYEDTIPTVYYPGNCPAHISEAAKAASNVLSTAYRIRSEAANSSFSWAAMQGIPALHIERGGRGLWSPEQVNDYKQDVLALLGYLGVLKTAAHSSHPPVDIAQIHYLNSSHTGWWYPAVSPGQPIVKGQKLGDVRDCFGILQHSYTADCDGVVLYMTISLAINKGDSLIAYGTPE